MPVTRRDFHYTTTSLGLALILAKEALAEAFPIIAKEAREVEYKFRRRDMEFETAEPTGTIVVNPRKCFLYLVLGNGMATRYGCSVGKSAKAWQGEVTIKDK
ncbi:MAG: hypothetical protein FJX63_02925, partial [Alphaproteobacteria bacterium]|nr:hypothetical protein [Alphaproteobacteria bacterium]